jgi:hypothetical protein
MCSYTNSGKLPAGTTRKDNKFNHASKKLPTCSVMSDEEWRLADVHDSGLPSVGFARKQNRKNARGAYGVPYFGAKRRTCL